MDEASNGNRDTTACSRANDATDSGHGNVANVAEERAQTNTRTAKQQETEGKAEGDEPDPRHWWKTAVAASFPT